MKITGIRRQKRNGSRVNVYVDGEYRLSLAAEVAIRAGLRSGVEIDDAAVESLEHEQVAWRVREAALRLLEYRPRGTGELRRRLIGKGFPTAPIDACLVTLRGAGLLDDLEFARTFVRDRVRSRPKGRTALLSELAAKGIDAEDARRAVDEVFEAEGEGEVDVARRALRRFRRRAGELPSATRRRLHSFLARRGFGGDTVRIVIAEIE